MSHPQPTITPEAAAHTLWHFGYMTGGAQQPGSFTTNLLKTFASADQDNFDKLAAAFPSYGAAVAAASYDPAGIQHLQNIAEQVASRPDVPQCPEALHDPDTGSLLRCVQEGRHDWHKTPGGVQWSSPVDSGAEVPF